MGKQRCVGIVQWRLPVVTVLVGIVNGVLLPGVVGGVLVVGSVVIRTYIHVITLCKSS